MPSKKKFDLPSEPAGSSYISEKEAVARQNVETARENLTNEEWSHILVDLVVYADYLLNGKDRERAWRPDDFALEAISRFLAGQRKMHKPLANLHKDTIRKELTTFLMGSVKSLVYNAYTGMDAKLLSLEAKFEQATEVMDATDRAASEMDVLLRSVDPNGALAKYFKSGSLEHRVFSAILETDGSAQKIYDFLRNEMPNINIKSIYNARASIIRKLKTIADEDPTTLARLQHEYLELDYNHHEAGAYAVAPFKGPLEAAASALSRIVLHISRMTTHDSVLTRISKPIHVTSDSYRKKVRQLQNAGIDVDKLRDTAIQLLKNY